MPTCLRLGTPVRPNFRIVAWGCPPAALAAAPACNQVDRTGPARELVFCRDLAGKGFRASPNNPGKVGANLAKAEAHEQPGAESTPARRAKSSHG